MKSQKRPFQKNVLNHCYQRTVDGGLIFYCYSDYLVWFTIVCTVARKFRIRILAMCPMPDHTHFSVIAASAKDFTGFFRDYTKRFSAEHNQVCHRSGPLFEGPFGSAPKYTDKAVRTNLIYVGNNPVERKLTIRAEEYRWSFLAYANSDHPFSKKLVIRDASWPMQKAVKEVKAHFKEGKYLRYAQLQRLFKPLNNEEKQQLTDFIISTYNVIDYQNAIQFFGSYDDMLLAMHSTTGSEYDLKEAVIGKSDAHYAPMVNTVMRELCPDDIHDILGFPPEKKWEVFQVIRKHSFALSEQIAKFLHMNVEWK